MKKWKLLVAVGLLAIMLLALYIKLPVQYDVPAFEARNGTQYWLLDEGVTIGYTHVAAKGTEKKEPVIYLHGGPGGKITDAIIEVLTPLNEDGHDLYFYDQVGSGHSTRLADISQYSVDRHREDLRSIVARIGAPKIILVGHSWGACLAMNYLQSFPETVSRLVLSGPGPILPIQRQLKTLSPPDGLELKAPEYSNQEGNEKVYSWRTKVIIKGAYLLNTKWISDREADDFFTLLNQELIKSTDCLGEQVGKAEGGGGYYSHIMTVKSFDNVEDKRAAFKDLTIPILLLRGQCDNQPWGYVQEYLDLLPNVQFHLIEGVGHGIINRKGEEYCSLILAFLEQEANKTVIP